MWAALRESFTAEEFVPRPVEAGPCGIPGKARSRAAQCPPILSLRQGKACLADHARGVNWPFFSHRGAGRRLSRPPPTPVSTDRKECVFRDHRRFPRGGFLGRVAWARRPELAREPLGWRQSRPSLQGGRARGLHRSGVPRAGRAIRQDGAAVARCGGRDHSNRRRPANSTTQSCTTSLALARSFSVSLFNCPQAASISRPRGVRTGLA
jgi:hypothetical protein